MIPQNLKIKIKIYNKKAPYRFDKGFYAIKMT